MKRILFTCLALQLAALSVLRAQQEVVFPDDFGDDRLDGKEVTITNTLTLTNNYSAFRGGSVTLSDGLLRIPTELARPDREMFGQQNALNAANQLYLAATDDYDYIDSDGTCRIGQTVTGLTGTASYNASTGRYTIYPTRQPALEGNRRPTAPGAAEGSNLRVASFNLEWYDDEDAAQRAKIVAALCAMQADVYALVEVCGNEAVEGLCRALNEALGTDAFAHTLNNQGTNQMNYFVYNTSTVEPYKETQQNSLALWNGNPYLPERKVAQGFTLRSNGERFVVCLNHWKAKDSDGDTGDGQGGSAEKRRVEAEATLQFVGEMQAYYEDEDVLVVGDLNAYSQEDPVRILEEGGLANQLQKYAPEGYSYAYYDNGYYGVGYLDHSLATPSLDGQICSVRPFHINADEPDGLRLGQSHVQEGNMYACSDHNPIVTDINLGGTGTGIGGTLAAASASGLTARLAGGTLTVACSKEMERIEVFDLGGRQVYEGEVAGCTSSLYVGQLAGGSYVVTVRTVDGGRLTAKCVAR